MIDIIITSYNEPKATLRAVNTFLEQTKRKDLRITVVDPFQEVEEFLRKNIKDKRFNFYLDPGEGKSYALNLLFQELGSDNKEDIFISTDGDVHVSDNAIEEIEKSFKDKQVGVVTARPVAIDSRNTKYGYWSHLVFDGIDKVRKKLSKNKKFFEASGYLFAIRKAVIFDFPIEASEDSVIAYLFWKKGYKIKYLPQIEVYVKNPDNWKDWLIQKIRNVKGHENLDKIFPDMPRTKSFFNEIKQGTLFAIRYPNNIKEIFWTKQLFAARLYLYLISFKQLRKKQKYSDGWREQETVSTRTLD